MEYARAGTAEMVENLDAINSLMGVSHAIHKKGEMEYSDINALLRERGMDFDLMEKFFSAKKEAQKNSNLMSRATISPKRPRPADFPSSPKMLQS